MQIDRVGHLAQRGRLGAFALVWFGASLAGRDAAASGAASGGVAGSLAASGHAAALSHAAVTLACANVSASGHTTARARATSLVIDAADDLADANLGYLAATTRRYPSVVVRFGAATYRLRDARIDDLGTPGSERKSFSIMASSFNASAMKFSADQSAALLLASQPTPSPSPTATPSATPSPTPKPLASSSESPRAHVLLRHAASLGSPSPVPTHATPAQSLALSGVGIFAIEGVSGTAMSETSLGPFRIEGESALRLIAPCVTGATVHGVAVLGPSGRSTYASLRIARIDQTFDRTKSPVSVVRFASVVKVAPQPQATATP